jgi:prepilin-type N-terminal cleavage/methylation domain-containing protein
MRLAQPWRKHEHGFTLIELAVVLLIVGLISGGLLSAWATQIVQQRINTTKANAETIKTALVNFVSRNNRLPCPAIDGLLPSAAAYGQEATTPGTCTGSAGIGVAPNDAARGIVPWIAVGLSGESASDAYNNRFTYQITKAATGLNATTLASLQGILTLHGDAPITLGIAPTGNQINGCNATAGNNSCNGFAVVVILSHGKNGVGAIGEDGTLLAAPTSAQEIQNAGNNNAFVRSDYSTVDANYFDDILLVLSPDDLLGPLVKDGAISSARAQSQKQMELSRDALIAQSVSSGLLPPPPLAVGNDGWGKALLTASVCGAAAGATAFTITSNGADRIAGLNAATGIDDDIVLTQSNDQLKSYIVKGGTPCP